MYTFVWKGGHVEVFLDRVFQFTADSMQDAEEELKSRRSQNGV